MTNILLGLSGSVAAIKAKQLVEALEKIGDVRIVATDAAMYFIGQSEFSDQFATPSAAFDFVNNRILRDNAEWPNKFILGQKILHIELRRWANCMVLAPMSANTLAKIAYGFSDNLLTSVVRAWDWKNPMFLAPAMNTMMWDNPPTEAQIETMQARGARIIGPINKKLACDDVGMGAMASIDEIYNVVNRHMRWHFPLENYNGIPINHHPGAFGFHRKKNHHTGVDLYTNDGEPVYAVEDGMIVHIAQFTGPELGHTWWEKTWGVMVEGKSGVINYGEVTPANGFTTGIRVFRGDKIGYVKRVLFEDKYRPDIPGHSTSMLHLELYRHGTRDFADWHDPQKNPDLLDPTPFLMMAEGGPRKTLTWDNAESKDVG